MKSAFGGWGARTRTWEWRNQNPVYTLGMKLLDKDNSQISANAVTGIVPGYLLSRNTRAPCRNVITAFGQRFTAASYAASAN